MYDRVVRKEGNVFANEKKYYQTYHEILSLLRGYQIYLEQMKKEIQVITQPYEFIGAFKQEDLKFLNEQYLLEITKDFVPSHEIIQQKFSKRKNSLGIDSLTSSSSVEVQKEIRVDKTMLSEFTKREIDGRIKFNGGREIGERWDPGRVINYTTEEYIQQMKQSSGHFAVHIINRSLVQEAIRDRYCIPRIIAELFKGLTNRLRGELKVPSFALHFTVDSVYSKMRGNTVGYREVALFCSIESLMENKAFLYSPFLKIGDELKSTDDWPVSGFSNNLFDKSHRFNFDELGILFIPEVERDNYLNYERLFKEAGYRPKRIYFYQEETIEAAIDKFIHNHQLKPQEIPIVSGELRLVRDNRKDKTTLGYNTATGEGLWFAAGNLQHSTDRDTGVSDLGFSAEELCRMAENLMEVKNRDCIGYQAYALAFINKAIELNPNFGIAYYLKGKLLSLNLERERIECFTKAIELGMPDEYMAETYYELGLFYESKDEFSQAREYFYSKISPELRRYVSINQWHIDSFTRLEKIVSDFKDRLAAATTLEERQKVLSDNFFLKEIENRQTFKKERLIFIELALQAAENIHKDFEQTMENQAKENLDKINNGELLDTFQSFRSIVNSVYSRLNEVKDLIQKIIDCAYYKDKDLESKKKQFDSQFKIIKTAIGESIENSYRLQNIALEESKKKKYARENLQTKLEYLRLQIDNMSESYYSLDYYYSQIMVLIREVSGLFNHAEQTGADINDLLTDADKLTGEFTAKIKRINDGTKFYQKVWARISGKKLPIKDWINSIDILKLQLSSPLIQQEEKLLNISHTQSYSIKSTDLGGIDGSTVSSAIREVKKDMGGIDFHAIPIVTQPIISPVDNFRAVISGITSSSLKNATTHNDSEWLQIEKMVSSGITPSPERVREYLLNSCQDEQSIDRVLDKVICCVAAITRLEEENAVVKSKWKELLRLIESNMQVSHLRLELKQLVFLPK